MKNIFIFLGMSLGFLSACIPLPSTNNQVNTNPAIQEKVLTTENFVYESNIRTIQFCPEGITDDKSNYLKPAVNYIAQDPPLVLEFDVLDAQINRYRAKVFHCDYNWQISRLNDIEVMNDYNDFQILTYRSAINTKVPYVHYTFKVPKVKMTGNYLLLVYREGNEKDYLITRRFVIYDNKVNVEPLVKYSNQNTERNTNQQIEFKINYSAYDVVNPREDIKVVIRQNYRWDNAILNLKPLYVRDFDKSLEYNHFNGENNFRGHNEFRRFDCKSVRFLGFNVNNIQTSDTLVSIRLNTDNSRQTQPYFRQLDYNGSFQISHYESGRGSLESDYVQVYFSLKAPEKAEGEVYVMGAFNDWQMNSENLMSYNPENQTYTGKLLLKQGEYNYYFGVKKLGEKTPNLEVFEGSFQDTENNYEVIVYHRPLGGRTDLVIGYKLFNSNQNR